ncbi:hypothetical protein [Actinoplanes solisilvae]|uniref:hypothetical protein n=1 Tax=Actinoplanes solisilvae TaxID=2486853 RepID=UPI000FD7744F|nr:hypothetical protein [Actinoplanes solisilvae]
MSDHHDFGDHDDFPVFDDHHDDGGHLEQQPVFDDHHDLYDTDDHPYEAPVVEEHHYEQPSEEEPQPLADHAAAVVAEDPVEVFPPALDVGELPEPVDGFPWIDTGSLGIVHAAALEQTPDPVRPEELAEYAGVDLPDAQDPWAALAGSEDPATSSLAKWWQEN